MEVPRTMKKVMIVSMKKLFKYVCGSCQPRKSEEAELRPVDPSPRPCLAILPPPPRPKSLSSASLCNLTDQNSMESSWAELPSELLRQVIKKLCITSLYSFKYVCRNWQLSIIEEEELSLLRSVPSPPWLTTPPPWSPPWLTTPASASFYNLTNKKVYLCNKQWRPPAVDKAKCVGSSHGWLAYIDNLCGIYITNPFIKHVNDESPVIKLPPIETLPCFEALSASSYPYIKSFKYSDVYSRYTYIITCTELFDLLINKLVMSAGSSEKNCVVMVIYKLPGVNFISYCKIGDTSWKTLEGRLKFYEDLYYSNNRFYAVCKRTCSIEVWELHDFSITSIHFQCAKKDVRMTIHAAAQICCVSKKTYLLELDGDILLVVKYIAKATKDDQIYVQNKRRLDEPELFYKTLYFDVYKMNPDTKEWGLVNCLGDYAAFLGVNNAVAFSVRDFPKLKRNSIYFTEEDAYPSNRTFDGRFHGSLGSGIFSFDDYNMQQCYRLGNYALHPAPLVWISPNQC